MTLIKQYELLTGERVVYTREPDRDDKTKQAEWFKLVLGPVFVEAHTSSLSVDSIKDGLTERLAAKLRGIADELEAL